MATEKNIVMKEFNGTDYDTLYPKTIGTQVDGIFTTEQTLTNNTKTLYGLGTNAVPDDVFAWLGKYNQYWWKKGVYVETSGYEEKQTAATSTVNLLYANDNTTTNKISYSDSISINQSTGTVSLKNPSTVTLSYNKYSESELKNLFAGKYIKGTKDSPLTIYLVGAKIGQTPLGTNGNLIQNSDSDTETGRYIRITYPALKVITSQQVTTPTIGDWSYLQSSNRNAYPDSGITDGYEYQYLGKPYENFLNLPTHIETGSYTGTGTSGTGGNKNTLNFSFAPQIVFIVEDCETNSGFVSANMIVQGQKKSNGVDYSSYLRWYITWSSDGTSVSWYANSGNADKQMNTQSRTYRYVAIG